MNPLPAQLHTTLLQMLIMLVESPLSDNGEFFSALINAINIDSISESMEGVLSLILVFKLA
jgi:hypothetical protein